MAHNYCHIYTRIYQCTPALKALTYCHIIGTEHSVSASNYCNSHVHGYCKKAYILKYLLDFKNNLINIGCATLYHLSMTYITVYNLLINSNCRILAVQLNYRFTVISVIKDFFKCHTSAIQVSYKCHKRFL